VYDNLKHLGLDVLDVVNLRAGGVEAPEPGSIAEQFAALAGLREQGLIRHLGLIAYVPYFPLGGFTPLQSAALDAVAGRLGATPMAVALAWLLRRSPNILLIPGTSSVAHLRENTAAAALTLPPDAITELDAIGG
jgi:pyridoxine 4-dehydrogenase